MIADKRKNNPFTKLKERFRGIVLTDLVAEAIKENLDYVEDLNNAQLEKGLRPDGSKIEPEYSPGYAAFKASIGMNPAVVNLKLEGDYHKGTTAKIEKYELSLFNTDKKDEMLVAKYGETMGLTKASRAALAEHILPITIQKLRKRIAG